MNVFLDGLTFQLDDFFTFLQKVSLYLCEPTKME
ncbi:MAG: hypothetical protein ACI815_002283 [Psychroserpens sp.]|jgi:hypothetical protein